MKLLLAVLLAPVFGFSQASVSAPWDITQTASALGQTTLRLKPVLDQLTPQEWVAKGAPDTYVVQWQAAKNEVGYVADAAAAWEKQPEKLSTALNVYFRLQTLENRLSSLGEGVRKYQNPAVADLIFGMVSENTANQDRLRQYVADLAEQKEQELAVIDKEAQRCRTQLNRLPAPAPPAAAKPKPAPPKPASK